MHSDLTDVLGTAAASLYELFSSLAMVGADHKLAVRRIDPDSSCSRACVDLDTLCSSIRHLFGERPVVLDEGARGAEDWRPGLSLERYQMRFERMHARFHCVCAHRGRYDRDHACMCILPPYTARARDTRTRNTMTLQGRSAGTGGLHAVVDGGTM